MSREHLDMPVPLRVPTDAAVVLREDFKPDRKAAWETSLQTRHMLALGRYRKAMESLTTAQAELAQAEKDLDDVLRKALQGPPAEKEK